MNNLKNDENMRLKSNLWTLEEYITILNFNRLCYNHPFSSCRIKHKIQNYLHHCETHGDQGEKQRGQWEIYSKFNKKKNGGKINAAKQADRDVPELLSGVEFSVARNGPDLYLNAVEKLKLYALTTYKNGADMWVSLKQDTLVTFTTPELDDNATPMQKEMRRIGANNTIKREEPLEAKLEAIYEAVLSICDPVLKDKVCNHEDYEEIDNKQDTLGLLWYRTSHVTWMTRLGYQTAGSF